MPSKHQNKESGAINHHSQIPAGIVETRKSELIDRRLFGASSLPSQSPAPQPLTTGKSPVEETKAPKLKHLNLDRPMGPKRQLPSKYQRHASSEAISQTMGTISSTSDSIIPKGLIVALTEGLTNYANQSKNGSTTSNDLGWLSGFRHGNSGKDKALEMVAMFKAACSKKEVIDMLDKFFTNPSTRFHNHSKSSYLLDALNKLLGSQSMHYYKPNIGEHYTLGHWGLIKNELEVMGQDKTVSTQMTV
ncbi:hypothetical protein [Legionella sp. W05-934-2]|uniref:hypothetical protein n=1 Tax=Legionella sp. W05-934-2 TaxID=1198649 RepID=UPI003462E99F